MGCQASRVDGAGVEAAPAPAAHAPLAVQLPLPGVPSPREPQSPGGTLRTKRSSPKQQNRHSKIFAEGLDASNITVEKTPKSPEAELVLRQALGPEFLQSFPAELSTKELGSLIDSMTEVRLAEGDDVVVAGLSVVQEGELELVKGGVRLRTLEAGAAFGEVTLLGGAQDDSLRVKASTAGVMWTLTPELYRRVKALAALDNLAERMRYLEKVRVLSTLSKQQALSLAQVLEREVFGEGDYIMTQGEPGLKCYFVVSGECVVYQRASGASEAVEVARRGVGECIGEAALLNDAPRNASVMACQPTVCLSLGKHDFDTLLGPLSDILDRNANFRALRALSSLSEVDDSGLEAMVRKLQPRTFEAGSELLQAGVTSAALYIIKGGEVCLKNAAGEVQATLAVGDHCGSSFHSHNKEEFSAQAVTQVEALALVQESYRASIAIIEDGAEQRRRSLAAVAPNRAIVFREQVPFESLRNVAVLGCGSFGQVNMVTPEGELPRMHPPCPPVFALKKMSKKNIVASKQLRHVLAEREIMGSLPYSNNVVQLYTTYQDEHNVYMLMELAHGGELFDLLNEYDCTGVPTAQFFIANVLLGLEHLHSNNIIYRDLKPENVVMGSTGYLKLIDLGFAKRVPYQVERNGEMEEMQRTFTLCGTPEYLAPECVLHHGHDRAADYWAMGVLLYEIMFMATPFGGAARGNLAALFRQISRVATHSNRPRFPAAARNVPDAVDLINKLLNGNPQRRLGMLRNGTEGIKSHPFFSGLDWAALEAHTLVPPHVPDVNGDLDTQNFQSSAQRSLDFPLYSGDQTIFAGF